MKCFDPVLCFRLEKKTIYRNWSFAKNSTHLRGIKPTYVFNCNKCIHCRKKRSIELAARCVLHSSLYTQNMFLTLTYDEKKEGYHNDFNYSDIQKFKKRLRAYCQRTHGLRIEVFNVHEYGRNSKKHWHLIVFGFSYRDKTVFTYNNQLPLYTSAQLSEHWPYGFSTIGDVSEASAMYQSQYMDKDFKNGNITNKKKSHSKHSGLGKGYFLKHYSQILRLGYIPFSGFKLPIPRYFQKLGHKHWCHFYERSAFFDTPQRKALYRPFKIGEENLDLANLFAQYKEIKQEKIQELEAQFDQVVSDYLARRIVPQFVGSGSNTEYDLKNKSTMERF